jgi:hypothetical protein
MCIFVRMKAKVLLKLSGIFMLLAFCFAMVPFAAFHHHETVCDIASDVPLKFRKEKDHSKHHIHQLEGKCFVCSNAIIKNFTSISPGNITIQQFDIAEYFSSYYFYTFTSIVELNNKAPPLYA